MFADFQVPTVSWEKESEPVMEDRTGLLQLFLLNQALNTQHPPSPRRRRWSGVFVSPRLNGAPERSLARGKIVKSDLLESVTCTLILY